MLLVGSHKAKKDVALFCEYLESQGIAAQCLSHDDEHELWVSKRDDLDFAKQEWLAFLKDTTNPRYQQKKSRLAEALKNRKLQQHYKRQFPRMRNQPVFTISLMVISVAVFLLMNIGFRPWVLSHLLLFMPYGLANLIQSEPWRLVTPVFLHFSLLHIAFNLYWLWNFGSLIERRESTLKLSVIVMVAAILSNLAQFYMSGPFFGGMSGVVYALFGYLWITAKRYPMSGYWIRQDIVLLMLGWLVLCFTGILGAVANFAHLAGLLVGVVCAFVRR